MKNKKIIEKRQQSNLNIYVVDNVSKSNKIKLKIKNKKEIISTKIKKIWSEKTNKEKQEINKKRIFTNLEKYGVENNSQLESNKEKIHKAW